jgi:hypothetical protein
MGGSFIGETLSFFLPGLRSFRFLFFELPPGEDFITLSDADKTFENFFF